MKPKLKDVADKAGVSPTTASMILSDKGVFPKDTIEKVHAAAKLLSYRKRKSCKKGDTESKVLNIGLLFYIDFSWAYVFGYLQPILEQIETRFNEKEYNLVLIPIMRTHSADEIFKKIKDAQTDGIFSVHYENAELFEILEKREIPLVVILISNLQSEYFTVCPDDFQGAYEGTLHLIQQGHRSIAFVESDKVRGPTVLADRFIGFKKAIDEYDLPFPDGYKIHFKMKNIEELHEKINTIISSEKRPTAIFVLDDYVTLWVYEVLKKMNLSVPEDISIIAPGDVLDYSQPTTPPITTMQIDTATMGRLAANLMIDRISGKTHEVQTLKVKPRLIQRGSCRKIESN